MGGVPDIAIARLCQIGFCLSSSWSPSLSPLPPLSPTLTKNISSSPSPLLFDLFVLNFVLRCSLVLKIAPDSEEPKISLVATLVIPDNKSADFAADDPEIEARAFLVALVDLAEALETCKLRVLLENSQSLFPAFARMLMSVGFVVRARTASLVPPAGYQLFTFRVLPSPVSRGKAARSPQSSEEEE